MRYVALCSVFLVAAIPLIAQVGGTGSIQGTVTDPSGAIVAGATVTATNIATGVTTVHTTTDAGFYVLPLLTPGEYSVTVKAAGFQTLTEEHVIVDALANVGLRHRPYKRRSKKASVESGAERHAPLRAPVPGMLDLAIVIEVARGRYVDGAESGP